MEIKVNDIINFIYGGFIICNHYTVLGVGETVTFVRTDNDELLMLETKEMSEIEVI